MSGGHFDYIDSRAKNEIFGYGDKWWNVFEDREISELVWDIFNLIKGVITIITPFIVCKIKFRLERE